MVRKSTKKDNKSYWKRLWTRDRWIKAFFFTVPIGLGYYLGELIFKTQPWYIALPLTTLFLALVAGNLLDYY